MKSGKDLNKESSMCHTSVRGKCMKLVSVPGTTHSLQLILLPGKLSVNYHHWVRGVCHRCDDLFSVHCSVMIHEGNIPVLGLEYLHLWPRALSPLLEDNDKSYLRSLLTD